MQIITKDGIKLDIKENALDDYEMLEILDAASNGKPARITAAFERLLGTEKKNEVIDHYRNEDGIAPASVLIPVIEDIFEKIKETNDGKNS